MAYAYEDEEENELYESEEMEDIDLDDDLNGIETPKSKKSTKKVDAKVQEKAPQKFEEKELPKLEETKLPKYDEKRIIDQNVPVDEKGRDFVMQNLLMADVEEKPKRSAKKELNTDDLLDSKDKFVLTTSNMITVKDEKYFKYFIGPNYWTLTHRKFNYAALFLGPVYLLYRKVYGVGFVWLILNLFVSIVGPIANANWIVLLIFLLLSYFACGYFANTIYVNHVGTKIVNFKIHDNAHLKQQCEEQGGTNIVLPLIIIVCYSIVFGIIGTIYGTRYYKQYMKEHPAVAPSGQRETFDGVFVKDDTVVMDDFITFNGVENYFKSEALGKSSIYYVYENPNSNYPNSTIEISVINNHKDPKLFIEAVANYEMELLENVKKHSYNGYTWYSINTTNANKDVIYASTIKDNKIVLVKFMYNYTYKDQVSQYFEQVLANIQ